MGIKQVDKIIKHTIFLVATGVAIGIGHNAISSGANNMSTNDTSNFISGEIAIGFVKGVNVEEAEKTLKHYGLNTYEFTRAMTVSWEFTGNSGKRFNVKVPAGTEQQWISKLSTDKRIYRAVRVPESNLLKFVVGKIGIGFRKGINKSDAEAILLKNGLNSYKQETPPNFGKVFFYESGEKYIVSVPDGEEEFWAEKLSKEESVYKAGVIINPDFVNID